MQREQNNLVSVSGNRCLVPQSVIPVDALIPFWMLLIQKCDTEVVATIKKNSHRKLNNQKLIMNNE